MKYKVIKKYPGGPELNAIVPARVKLKGGAHSIEAKDWPEFFASEPYTYSIDIRLDMISARGRNFGNGAYIAILNGVPTEFGHNRVRVSGHADTETEAKTQCEQAVLRFFQENKIISHV